MKKLPLNKIITSVGVLAFCLFLTAGMAMAQVRVGASYEVRNADPTNGFGIRIEPQLFKIAMLEVDARASFSYFSEKNSASTGGITYSRDFKNYEYGVAGVGRVDLGIVDPFVSVGVGNTTFKLNSDSKNSLYYTGSIGIEASPIPVIKPFIEYQLTGNNLKDIQMQAQAINYRPSHSVGRWIFGIYLNF